MSRLLHQGRIDQMVAVAQRRVDRNIDRVRNLMYRDGADSRPPGFDNLNTPDSVRVFSRYVSRQAEREQRGVVAGDLNQALADNPAVQQMAATGAEVPQ